jgi:uncharacterized protein (UPF0333 family)
LRITHDKMIRSYCSLVVLIIFSFFFIPIHANVLVQTRNGTQVELYSTEIIYVGKHNILNLTLYIRGKTKTSNPMINFIASQRQKIAESVSAEVTVGRGDVGNKIYMVQTSQSIDEVVVEVQNNGALGVLVISNSFCKFYYDIYMSIDLFQ